MNFKGKILASSIVAFAVLISINSAHPIKNNQQPQSQTTRIGRSKRETVDEEQPWWHKPCGPVHNHQRHIKSKECTEPRIIHKNRLKPVIQQLNKFRSFYRHQIEKIEEYYSKDRNCKQLKKEEYSYDWLPQKPKVKTFRNKPEEALIQFHKEIQIFAVALHQLKKTVEPNSVSLDTLGTRNKLLTEISLEMKAVMCELEALVNHTCKNLVVDRIPLNYLKQYSSQWSSSTDLTKMCIQDRGVLQAYHDFIRGWKHVFIRIKKERNGKGLNKTQENTNNKKDTPKHGKHKAQQTLSNRKPNTTNRQRNITNNSKQSSQNKQRQRRINNNKQKTHLKTQEKRRQNKRKLMRNSSTTRRSKNKTHQTRHHTRTT